MKKFITKWLSNCILNLITDSEKHLFRQLEKASIKTAEARAHRLFNQTCINSNLLPNYTSIYKYICK